MPSPNIDAKTRLCGVIGHPVKNSLSPVIHNAAFHVLKMNYVYLAFEVGPEHLEEAIAGARALGIEGLNVTMPHKESCVRYLDELDDSAKKLLAVNTIVFRDGRAIGHNTDGIGFLKSCERRGVEITGKNVLLLGAGGAARSIAYAVLSKRPTVLCIANRTLSKAKAIQAFLMEQGLGEIKVIPLSDAQDEVWRADIIINATSVGMGSDLSPISDKGLGPNKVVYDVVYHPLETRLLKMAKRAGAKTISGLDMLIMQAAESFRIWTGVFPPIEVMEAAALSKLRTEGAENA